MKVAFLFRKDEECDVRLGQNLVERSRSSQGWGMSNGRALQL
jgi:hypothetical protein